MFRMSARLPGKPSWGGLYSCTAGYLAGICVSRSRLAILIPDMWSLQDAPIVPGPRLVVKNKRYCNRKIPGEASVPTSRITGFPGGAGAYFSLRLWLPAVELACAMYPAPPRHAIHG